MVSTVVEATSGPSMEFTLPVLMYACTLVPVEQCHRCLHPSAKFIETYRKTS